MPCGGWLSAVMDAMFRGVTELFALLPVGRARLACRDTGGQTMAAAVFQLIPHPHRLCASCCAHPFCEDLRIVSDYDFFLGAYLAGESFRVLPVVTALHQRGGASGNVECSEGELERVRRDRLGWRYPLINGIAFLYRQYKLATRRREV